MPVPFVKHNIRVPGIVIHTGVELGPAASLERVAQRPVLAHPFAQLHNGRLV